MHTFVYVTIVIDGLSKSGWHFSRCDYFFSYYTGEKNAVQIGYFTLRSLLAARGGIDSTAAILVKCKFEFVPGGAIKGLRK